MTLKKLPPITLKDYNKESLDRRIQELLDRPDQNWYLVKRGSVFINDYLTYIAVMKQGDDTFVR
jgi:hypothetical protein